MLGAIGAASLAAHKFWPKGVTYGDKDDWETAHEKKEAEERREQQGKGKGKGSQQQRRHQEGEGEDDGDPDAARRRYIEERYRRRPALPAKVDGDEGADFWERRERRADTGPPPPRGQRYIEDGEGVDRPPPRRRIEAPPPRDEDDDDYPPPPRRRIAAAAVPERDDVTNRAEPARSQRDGDDPAEHNQQRRPPPPRVAVDGGLPPFPPAPTPPRSVVDTNAPLIVPAGASRAGSSSGSNGGRGAPRYYIDGDTIVVPSVGERAFVVRRDAPAGQRLRAREFVERGDGGSDYRR